MVIAACSPPASALADDLDSLVSHSLEFAETQLTNTVAEIANPTRFPKSTLSDGTWKTKSSSNWASGFFPGSLWYLYERSAGKGLREWAENWTAEMAGESSDTSTHDVGFKIFGSFGNGYRITGDPLYRDVVLDGAASLATRYNAAVGCVRSWDNRTFPVIIDNMMNLEILFWASRHGGDPAWYDMAVSHALRTRTEHVRPDGSTVQIVDFDPDTGEVLAHEAHQGFSVESTWSRGQAWGLYGFTMTYRETGDPVFLLTAQLLADYFVDNLPADHVPYWDFDAPDIPSEEKDTSAAAIAASGLLELAGLTEDAALESKYRLAATNILSSLSSAAYLAEGSISSGILLHGVGNRPGNKEVDVSLAYGDYYFVEALMRYFASQSTTAVGQVPPGAGLRLSRPRPNPTQTGTSVTYEMSHGGHVSLAVYDVRGRYVRSLIDEPRPRGSSVIHWDGRDQAGRAVGPGVYFLRLRTPQSFVSRKVTVSP